MAVVSSHCLNGVNGTHAGGIKVSLIDAINRGVICTSETDDGGRLAMSLSDQQMAGVGSFELIFETGPYWKIAANGAGVKDGAFHPIEHVVLRFSMPRRDAKYHMPVIISPNGYSTWGSVPE